MSLAASGRKTDSRNRASFSRAARIVPPSSLGLPLRAHCQLSSCEPILGAAGNMVVELSRVCISRRYSRRRGDPFFEAFEPPGSGQHTAPLLERRQQVLDLGLAEPLLGVPAAARDHCAG